MKRGIDFLLQQINDGKFKHAGNAKVTLSLKETPAGKVLDALLASFKHVGYCLQDMGEFRIETSTTEDLQSAQYSVVRVYDIRILLRLDSTASRAETIHRISQDIESKINPDTWRSAGGTP